jgi:ATP-dependent DNA ligase
LAVFRELIQDGTAEENAEFARIILKDLEIRFKVLPWFHPHAYQHYAQSHDLRKLVKDCQAPGFELGEPEVHPGRYAAVMLTARPARSSLARVAGNLASGIAKDGSSFFYMEPKLDGERVQLHKIGNDVQTYSRSARESSVMFAELLRDAVCRTVRAMNAILDGEVVVWYRKTDQEEEGWVKFESLRRAIRDMSDQKVPLNMLYTLKYIVFDVLYIEHDHPLRSRKLVDPLGRQGDKPVENLHGEPTSGHGSGPEYSSNVFPASVPVTADSSPVDSPSRRHRPSNALIKYSLQRRLELLKANIRVTQGHAEKNEHENYKNGYVAVVEVIESKAGSSEGDLMEALTQYVDGGYEGLIAKNPQKPYILAHRDPTCSIKLKPDYFDGGLQDIDVVILGAKRGKGIGTREGRAGELSSFLIGARTHNSDEAKRRYRRNEQGSWTPIGSVGTGYSVDELTQLLKRLQGHWRRLNRADRQAWPSFWDTSRAPDSMFRDVSQWIDPRDSVVLQVRAYELARNRGFALRFPRCERIREDSEKPYYDVVSVDELIELDNCKIPAVIASANGNDEDEVVETETGKSGRKRSTAEASVIARLEAGNAKVTRAAGGKRQAFSHETAADVSDITERLAILHGSIFQVYASHGQAEAKHELERLIYRLGGEFDQRLTSRTTHCVGLAPNDRMVISHIRTGRSAQREDRAGNRLGNVSVLRPDWFHECERKGYAVPILRRHLFFASRDLNAILSEEFDIFGDGWVTPTSVDSLTHCFGVMDAMVLSGEFDGNPQTAKDENIECAVSRSMRKAGSLFWGLYFYVPQQRYRHLLIAAELLLDAYGAVLLDKRSGERQEATENRLRRMSEGAVTLHVLVEKSPNPDTESAQDFDPHAFSINAGMSLDLAQMSFVSSRWVNTCLREKALVPAFV